MARQLDLPKQQRWLRHVQRWQRSRLSIRDFCAVHRLSEPSFYAWRRLLTQRGLLTPGDAPPQQDDRPTTPLFVAATIADTERAPQPLEVVLADGLSVRITAGFDAATLRRLLALLREPSC